MIGDIYNPAWLRDGETNTKKYLEEVKNRLREVVSAEPVVTVCVVAYNEEQNIAQCLDSLSRSVASVPFDVIVVNNNSTDSTQDILDELQVVSYFEKEQGCGMARETGQRNARGKYILMADADCFYPKGWIEVMYRSLTQNGVVAVYSKHSFLGNSNTPRWKYAIYEIGKNIIQEIRHIKRPYLNAYGMSFGYVRELGLKEGYVRRNIRGEDGRLCYDLMKYGKVKMIRAGSARVWTQDRNFGKDGGLRRAARKRFLRELSRFSDYFNKPAAHDTKVSENSERSESEYREMIKDNWIK